MSQIHIKIHRKSYSKRYFDEQSPPEIHKFELTVEADEFVCLFGPSGCGKTTLLNIIAGLDTSFEGEIITSPKRLRDLRLGFVFQEPRLLPWRTVRENIDLARDATEDPKLVDHLLELMDLQNVGDQYPERLSLGMSRRVALVRAFAVKPQLLLMDEPLVSLDAPTARRIRELLLTAWLERPHTVIFVTHDLDEALAISDRLVFLKPNPMRIAADIKIDMPRNERQSEKWRSQFMEEVCARFPEVLTLV